MRTTKNLLGILMAMFLVFTLNQNGNCQQQWGNENYPDLTNQVSNEIVSNPEMRNDRELSDDKGQYVLEATNLPIVTFAGGEAQNCSSGIILSGNKNGWLAIVHEDAIVNGQPIYDLATENGRSELQTHQYGNSIAFFVANGSMELSLEGILPGTCYAFHMDQLGNTSSQSEETLDLTPCMISVESLTDLRNRPHIYDFNITGEVLVSYEESPVDADPFKFVQDQNAGIKIVDRNGILPESYGIGAGLTGLTGVLEQTDTELIFIPISAPSPASTGNVIYPVELTYNEYFDNCYLNNNFESMLVRITTPIIAFDDYGLEYTTWEYDMLDLATTSAAGNYTWFIQKTFNTDYIGTEIPIDPTVYQGIRTNVTWGGLYGLMTPRNVNDIIVITSGELTSNQDPTEISNITPTLCGSVNIDIINEAIGDLTITALYLDNSPGTEEFALNNPIEVPFTLGTWAVQAVLVDFCPVDFGNESTTLFVEYGAGSILEIPVNGTTSTIHQMDWTENFNDAPLGDAVPEGWSGDSPYNSSLYITNVPSWFPTADGTNMMYMRNRAAGKPPVELVSPGIEVIGPYPIVTWSEIATTAYNNTGTSSSPRNLYISTNGITWTLVDSYLTSSMPDAANGDDYRTQTYSLASYIGQTIWWKFELISNNNEYIYWAIDNVTFGHEELSLDQESLYIQSTFPGICKTGYLNLENSGLVITIVSSIELDPSLSPNFTFLNLPALPFQLDPGQILEIEVEFCPVGEASENTSILVNYGNEKQISSNVSGELAPIYRMNYIETFNETQRGQNIPENWDGRLDYNLSIYFANNPAWVSSPDSSLMLIMRNRMVIDGSRVPVSVTSPRIMVQGANPVVSWQEISLSNFNTNGTLTSPRNLLVSTNGIDFTQLDSYLASEMPDVATGDPWRFRNVSLSAYIGQTVWIKWEMESYNDEYIYWGIDNICIMQAPGPAPSIINNQDRFNISLTNTAKPRDVRLSNASTGTLEVQNIEFIGNGAFVLSETVQYPLLINGYNPANSDTPEELALPVVFTPPFAGSHSEIMRVTYGPNSEYQEEIILSGEGFECGNIQVAESGENWAASQNSIFRYTADNDQYVTVSSCHPSNSTVPIEYSYDTYLEIYTECGGSFVAGTDDAEWDNCEFNRASSTLTMKILAGESILIFWPKYFISAHDEEGFVFTISTENSDVFADFSFSRQLLDPEGIVNYNDESTGLITDWLWTFDGGVPNTSTDRNPANILYPSAGRYDVTLAVSNELSDNFITKEFAITVENPEDLVNSVVVYDFSTGGMKSTGGWTFVDLTGRGFNWMVRDDNIGGNHTDQPPLASTTGATGFLVLPADEYNSPTPNINTYFTVDAYAQSPNFDCSALDLVVFKFEQSFRHCCDENAQMLVMVSNDNGASWDSYDVKNGREPGEVHGDPVEIVKLDISASAKNQAEVIIRFYWQGSVRDFWMIDDVDVYGYTNICHDLEFATSDPNFIYLGYLPTETLAISVSDIVSGVGPFTYLWETGETTESIFVSPEQSTSYGLSVFDGKGCETQTEIFVSVVDVRCGKKNNKVLMCVNNKNPHTICVSPNAVPAHLANGASFGDCGDGKPVSFGFGELEISIYPNPSGGKFTVQGTLTIDDQAVLTIRNVLGQTVYYEELNLPNGSFIKQIDLPSSKAGMYFLTLRNGGEIARKSIVIE